MRQVTSPSGLDQCLSLAIMSPHPIFLLFPSLISVFFFSPLLSLFHLFFFFLPPPFSFLLFSPFLHVYHCLWKICSSICQLSCNVSHSYFGHVRNQQWGLSPLHRSGFNLGDKLQDQCTRLRCVQVSMNQRKCSLGISLGYFPGPWETALPAKWDGSRASLRRKVTFAGLSFCGLSLGACHCVCSELI